MLKNKMLAAMGGLPPAYIEDVFSTWLYTGNGATQTITNGIDLAGKGGLVWTKARNSGTEGHLLFDTARGVNKYLQSQNTDSQTTVTNTLSAFNSNGFTLGTNGPVTNNVTYSSWTFREQPKFFDVVTYTGNGASNRNISHLLDSTPGAIIIKRTDSTGNWIVGHRGSSGTEYLSTILRLNTTDAAFVNSAFSATWTSNTFQISAGGASDDVNVNGATYVAYLFAHNAGGFGLTGTDNVISCGTFTTDSNAYANVNLGYEPQWVLQKTKDSTQIWYLTDSMRGATTLGGQMAQLFPNTSSVESGGTGGAHPTATGFESTGIAVSETMVYIAIRRGPMKVPTTGTSVFSPNLSVGTTGQQVTTGFPVDLQLFEYRPGGGNNYAVDRLRGISSNTTETAQALFTNSTGAESTGNVTRGWNNTGYQQPSFGNVANDYINWNFRRAPGFFDEVCYSGAGTQALTHNLGVVPEMFILKNRAGGTDGNWIVYHAAVGNTAALQLNLTAAPATTSVYFANTSPTSTVFTVGTNQSSSGGTYVAYLFASCPGVSKVGSYTGNGSSQTINCAFTGGARFVMIKRTDSTGDWYIWDTARGIVAGNDPRLSLNTTAVEVTTDDSVDTDSTGFVVNQLAATNINVTSATYIFLAIA